MPKKPLNQQMSIKFTSGCMMLRSFTSRMYVRLDLNEGPNTLSGPKCAPEQRWPKLLLASGPEVRGDATASMQNSKGYWLQ